MVGAWLRVSDSVQPVHSWKESQMTEGRLAFSRAAAMAGIADGGSAIMDAVAAQNFMNPRREMPFSLRRWPSVLSSLMRTPQMNVP